MQAFTEWLFGTTGRLAVAGALGGIVRWLAMRQSTVDGLISVVVGSICSVYLSPLAIPLMDPILRGLVEAPEARSSFSGFIIGLGGIGVAGFVMDLWRAKREGLKKDKKDE